MGTAALLAATAGVAAACGFDSPLGNTFTPMHPKSMAVAFAVRDATVAGAIEPATDPAAAGQAGYWRAVGHLTALQRALSATHVEGGAAVSVLFIDSGLWARLTPTANGFAMDVHTEGAKDGDVAIITSEPVLAAILEKRLSAADALQRGLIVVDGERAAVETTSRWLAAALVAPAASTGMPQAVRLFGPVRQ
ncbi:MAG: hypothetical protein AB1490_26230 [Pseudomonadota bacterium]